MDFRILGPLEVHDGDRLLTLGGPRQRALLALLLLHANEVVSSDRLIAELWREERLEDHSKALHVAVSRLRRTLEPDRSSGQASGLLVTRPPGYELRLVHGQLDLQRFEDQVAVGREALAGGDAVGAAKELSDALAIWRGPPLADVAYESFSQVEIPRLEELRLSALEDRIAADLELARHANLVAQLQELVQRHPLRERLRGQLMLALYRSGRQADALEVYQDARRALTNELGIEPSRELRDLQQAVLRQDLVIDPRSAGDGNVVPSRGALVGRERELTELAGALEVALAGRGQLVLLVGEPGIGKSRLADELVGQARSRGARVIIGRCWEVGGAPAYWPWVQSLRTYVRETEADPLRLQLGNGAAQLGQLLPELRAMFPDLPEPPALESEDARFVLFDAVSSLLQSAARVHPLVLLLDDLHAADEPSLLLLRFLVREIADSRLLVVCALRDVDPTLREPLASALAELVREPHSTQIALAGLTENDVGQFIELSTGIEPAPGLARAIHAETEGNPLFVVEVVRLLDGEDRIADADASLQIPPGVRAVIGQRVGRLSESCRDLLVLAALMGREFGLQALAQLSNLDRDELLDALDEAIAERVVSDVPGSPGRLRFGHALIRDTLYDELSSARRLHLHHEAARALETVYAADLEPHLAELAHHFFAAAGSGVDDKAIEYARRAGDRAASQLAYEEAVRLYNMALKLAAQDQARCEVLLALGDVEARAGNGAMAKSSFRDAADLGESLGLPEQLAHAALGYGGRLIWEVSRDDADHASLLERALTALGQADSTLRVRLLTRLAGGPLRDATFPPERRQAVSQEALEMARRIGEPATLAYALAGYIPANHSPEFTHKQVALSTELIDVAIVADDLERAWEGHENRLVSRIELGDMAGAKTDLAAMAELAEELRQPSQGVAAYRAHIALLEGQLAEAEDFIATARQVSARALSWNAAVTYGLQLYLLRREQGRLDEIEDFVRRAVKTYSTYPIWRCVRAQMAAELGHAAEAHHALDALAADSFVGLPFDEEWLVSMGLLAETTHILEDTSIAFDLYRLLVPYGDRVAVSYPEMSTGSVAYYLGLLAATSESWDNAQHHFETALQMNERIGARSWLVHTQRHYARMLLARNASGDRHKAQQLHSRALTAQRELGITRS